MLETKHKLRTNCPKIYSQEMLHHLFLHPYTKVSQVEKALEISRITATKYLNILVDLKVLSKKKFGKTNYYINVPFLTVLKEGPQT